MFLKVVLVSCYQIVWMKKMCMCFHIVWMPKKNTFRIRNTQHSWALTVHKQPRVYNTTYTIQSRVYCPNTTYRTVVSESYSKEYDSMTTLDANVHGTVTLSGCYDFPIITSGGYSAHRCHNFACFGFTTDKYQHWKHVS